MCSASIQRHAECVRTALFDNELSAYYDTDYTYAVLCERGVRTLAIVMIDYDTVVVKWGSALDAIRSIMSVEKDADGIFGHVAVRNGSREMLWLPLDPRRVGACGHAIAFGTTIGVSLPRELPGLHVFSSPTHREHLLVTDRPGGALGNSVADCVRPDRTEPHIIAEVGVVMEERYTVTGSTEPIEWCRCTVTLSGSSITFDPPFVVWSYNGGMEDHSDNDCLEWNDRTLLVRFMGRNATFRHLVPPGVVRMCKLDRSSVDVTLWKTGWRVEATEQIATTPVHATQYPKEHRAVAGLAAQVVGISSRAAKVIQKAWRRAVSDPSYRICETRLMREFGDGVMVGL